MCIRPSVPCLVALSALLSLLVGCPFFDDDRAPAGAPGVRLTRVASGLTAPVALAFPADGSGRMFVVSQTGTIEVFGEDGTRATAPFLDIRDRVVALSPSYDERGLLGLAFHPEYAANGRFFVYYNAPTDDPASDSEVRLSEFRVSAADADTADAQSERILLRILKPQAPHNAGQLAFGPDGYLYISTGDGGGVGDAETGHNPLIGNAQDKGSLLGKILRIDVNSDGEIYGIPPDNPFIADAGARPEIWALGFRNPWRFSFDDGPGGTGRLFAGDVGQALREEVNIVVSGGNYGWRVREGTLCFDPEAIAAPPADCADTAADGAPLIAPILEYGHAEGSSVIGGYVYRGAAAPAMRGRYVFADYSQTFLVPSGRILVAEETADGRWSFEEMRVAGVSTGRVDRYIYAFGRDPEGELYVLTNSVPRPVGDGGEVHRIELAVE